MLIQRFALAAFLIGLAACQSTTRGGLSTGDRSKLEALDSNFSALAVAGKYEELFDLYYTDDAMFMAPNEPAAKGRAAVLAALRKLPPLSSMVVRADEMVGLGDTAYAVGGYTMTLRPSGGASITDTGKFVVIYRKQQDGSWKVSHDIFNSDLPVPGQ